MMEEVKGYRKVYTKRDFFHSLCTKMDVNAIFCILGSFFRRIAAPLRQRRAGGAACDELGLYFSLRELLLTPMTHAKALMKQPNTKVLPSNMPSSSTLREHAR